MTQDCFCLILLVLFTFFVIVDHNVNKSTCGFNNNKESKQNQQNINRNNLESCDICSNILYGFDMSSIAEHKSFLIKI